MGYVYKNSKGVDWHLNCKDVTLKGGKTYTIYFFSKDSRSATACDLPDNKQVVENAANGFPICKNK